MNSNLLKDKAHWVWRETLAIHRRVPETRIASSLSPIEIFVALYYGGVLRFDPSAPLCEQRDRCIISKGHGSICMYPILADLGFFPESELQRICQSDGILGGIPDPVIPGYETVNGSLGHGLGVAAGIALALSRKAAEQHVFVLTGDGELQEGACWEAIMFAGQHGLDRLNLIVDNNKIAMLGYTADSVSVAPALVGAPICAQDPVGARTTNHQAISMLLGMLSRQQIVLMPTTNSAYGSGERNNYCTEESLLRPISQYAIDKVAVEKELMEHPNAVSLPAGNRIRHVAADAHRPAGERFYLSRCKGSRGGAVRGPF